MAKDLGEWHFALFSELLIGFSWSPLSTQGGTYSELYAEEDHASDPERAGEKEIRNQYHALATTTDCSGRFFNGSSVKNKHT